MTPTEIAAKARKFMAAWGRTFFGTWTEGLSAFGQSIADEARAEGEHTEMLRRNALARAEKAESALRKAEDLVRKLGADKAAAIREDAGFILALADAAEGDKAKALVFAADLLNKRAEEIVPAELRSDK